MVQCLDDTIYIFFVEKGFDVIYRLYDLALSTGPHLQKLRKWPHETEGSV